MTIVRDCLYCGNEFQFDASARQLANGRGKYCSIACRSKAKIGVKQSKEMLEKVRLGRLKKRPTTLCSCKKCGKEFAIRPSYLGKTKYCSKECLIADRPTFTLTCPVCGKEFLVPQSKIEHGIRHCSKACGKIARKGKRLSRETRAKLSVAHKGKKKSGYNPEDPAVRATIEMRAWRASVLERDCYMCGFCGQAGEKLQADHIRPFSLYPERRLDLANGQTLCKPCHKRKTDFDRIWYDNFRTRL